MNDSERERWERLADAIATEMPVSSDDASFVESYDDACAVREREVYGALLHHGEAKTLDAGDRERAQAAMAEYAAESGRGRSWLGLVGASFVAVAAVALLWTQLPGPRSAVDDGAGAGDGHVTVISGALMLNGVEFGPGELLPVDRWVVASGRACVTLREGTDEGRGCVAPSSRIRVHDERLELATGALEFAGTGSVTVGEALVVASDAEFQMTVTAGQHYIQSSAGTVQIVSADKRVQSVPVGERVALATPELLAHAGQDLDDDESIQAPTRADGVGDGDGDGESEPDRTTARRRGASPTKRLPPGAMLSAARTHVADGHVGRALASYAALRRQHPQSPEANAANVSIGQLELRRGQARAALRAYSRYLARGGPLAEEAHWGKIRALHRLKRHKRRDQAIAALRALSPSSLYLERAASLSAGER